MKKNLEDHDFARQEDAQSFAGDDDFFNQVQESEPRRFGLLDYLSVIGGGLAFVGIYLFWKRDGIYGILHYAINATFFVGMFCLMIGVFSLCNQEGLYDGAGYGVRKVWDGARSAFHRNAVPTYKSFQDYRRGKQRKRKGTMVHFLYIAALFLAVSTLLTMMQ